MRSENPQVLPLIVDAQFSSLSLVQLSLYAGKVIASVLAHHEAVLSISAEAAPDIFQLLSEEEDLLPRVGVVDPLNQRLLLWLLWTVCAAYTAATGVFCRRLRERVAAGQRSARHGRRTATRAGVRNATVVAAAAKSAAYSLLGETRAGQLHITRFGRHGLALRFGQLERQQLLLL